MTGTYTYEELQSAYREFQDRLFNEIKALKKEKESLELLIRNDRTLVRVLNGSKKDPLFIIENEGYFKNVDNSKELDDFLNALKMFSEKGFLDNSVVPNICNNIYNLQSLKDEVSRLETEISESELKNIELKEKTDLLEDLKSNRMISLDLVREYAHKFEFDKSTYRKVILSYLQSLSRKTKTTQLEETPISEIKDTNIEETNTNIFVQDNTVSTNKFVQDDIVTSDLPSTNMFVPESEDVNEIDNEEPLTNALFEVGKELSNDLNQPTLENPTLENIEDKKLDEAKNKYKLICDEYNELMNKYYNIISNLPSSEQYNYTLFTEATKNQPFDFGEYNECYAVSVAYKVFESKKDVEEQIQLLSSSTLPSSYELDVLGLMIEEFNGECTKLQLLDNKLVKSEMEQNELAQAQYVYFLVDSQGNLDADTSNKELMSAYEKMAKYDRVDSFVKKRSIKNKNNFIDRTVYSQRVDKNTLLNFIKVNVDNNTGIMVLNGCPLSDEYSNSQKNAERLINQKSMVIKAQINLIEKQDPEYLEIQKGIRDNLATNERVM